jgi:hypothetical protein
MADLEGLEVFLTGNYSRQEADGSSVIVFTIRSSHPDSVGHWEVEKRFSQFSQLKQDLNTGMKLPWNFPMKNLLKAELTEQQRAERQALLQVFLQALLRTSSNLDDSQQRRLSEFLGLSESDSPQKGGHQRSGSSAGSHLSSRSSPSHAERLRLLEEKFQGGKISEAEYYQLCGKEHAGLALAQEAGAWEKSARSGGLEPEPLMRGWSRGSGGAGTPTQSSHKKLSSGEERFFRAEQASLLEKKQRLQLELQIKSAHFDEQAEKIANTNDQLQNLQYETQQLEQQSQAKETQVA